MKRLILQITSLIMILGAGAAAIALAQQENRPSGTQAVAATGNLPSSNAGSMEWQPETRQMTAPTPLDRSAGLPMPQESSSEGAREAAAPSSPRGGAAGRTGSILQSLIPGQSRSPSPPKVGSGSTTTRFSDAGAASSERDAPIPADDTHEPSTGRENRSAPNEVALRPDSHSHEAPDPLSSSSGEPARVPGYPPVGKQVPSNDIRGPIESFTGEGVPEGVVPPHRDLPVQVGEDSHSRANGTAPVPGGVRGNGTPGEVSLEGPQSPQIVIEKVLPPEIQLGNPTPLKILIRNVGTVTAQNVVLRDQIPHGTRLIKTVPESQRGPSGEVIWQLGDLAAAQETMALLELVPEREGEIGSVARAEFTVAASARSRVTKPELALEMTVPEQPHLHKDITFNIKISNPGTGTARNVILEERVPEELEHPAGKELLYKVGDLKPGETKDLTLTMHCAKPGKLTNHLLARADGNLNTESQVPLEVLAPRLEVSIDGPRRRFLERLAEYDLVIHNSGTASAYNVDLVAHLPEGLQFEKTNNNGYYESSSHTVHWALEELPQGQSGTVKLVALPIASGEHEIHFAGKAEGNLSAESTQEVSIDGIPAVYFEVADRYDPVEVGGESTYEVRLINEGTKVAENVTMMVQLSPGTEFVSAEGPTEEQIDGGTLQFAPIARLMPKEKQLYQVRIKCLTEGDHRFRVQVISEDMQSPVTKEENTRVFADQ